MAELEGSTSGLTLLELAKRSNNKQSLEIAEVLNETNSILQDMVWVEANQPTSHVGTQRTVLPAGSWRKINGGVSGEASQTEKVTEGIGMLESYSNVDKALVDLASDPAAFRWNEDKAFVEGLGQTLADTLLSGSTVTDPEKFNGFQTRYPSTTVGGTNNVILSEADDTGTSYSSIYIVQWGPNRVHMIYPSGHKTVGIEVRDLGEQTDIEVDSTLHQTSKLHQVYRTHFKFWGGLFIHDPRCVKRIANIDTTDDYSSVTELEIAIIKAINLLPYDGLGATIYCNSRIKSFLAIRAQAKSNVNLSLSNAFGGPILSFWGYPIKRWDSITNTEDGIA